MAVYRYPFNCVDIVVTFVTFRSESHIPVKPGRTALKIHIRYIDGVLFRGGGGFRTAGTADRLSGSIAVIVQHKLEGQVIVSRCRDGDNIAAFQNANDRGGTKVRLCKNKAIFARVCSVSTAGGWIRRFPLPCCAIYCNLSDCRNIVMGCIPKSHIPVIAKKIFVKDNLANCNSLMYDCLERGGDGHVLTGHDKGVLVGIITILSGGNCTADTCCGQRIQHIASLRVSRHRDGIVLFGSSGTNFQLAVFESGCHGHIVCGCFSAAGIGNNRDSVVCSINAQCQRFISIRRDNASVFT